MGDENKDVKKEEPLFFCIDTRQWVGNCRLFWAKEGHGYTIEVDKAELFTDEQIKRKKPRQALPVCTCRKSHEECHTSLR